MSTLNVGRLPGLSPHKIQTPQARGSWKPTTATGLRFGGLQKGLIQFEAQLTGPTRKALQPGSYEVALRQWEGLRGADIEESLIIFTVWFPHKAIFQLLCDRGSEWMNPVGGNNDIYLFPVPSLLFKR
jgi:hypothetical protein